MKWINDNILDKKFKMIFDQRYLRDITCLLLQLIQEVAHVAHVAKSAQGWTHEAHEADVAHGAHVPQFYH